MSFLARRVKGPLWAQAADPARWVKPVFPYELLSDLGDRDGLSVWEVSSVRDPKLKSIAAALVCGTKGAPGKEIQSVEFRLVAKSRVERLGITVNSTEGDTRNDAINADHRELSELNSTQAVGLLRLLNDGRARVFSARSVADSTCEDIVRQRLPQEVLTRDLLWSIHRLRPFKVTITAQS